MRRVLAILALGGACFGGAFAVGGATRHPARHRAPPPADVVAGQVAVGNLTRADGLPGLRAAARKKRPPVTTAEARTVAQAPRRAVPVPVPQARPPVPAASHKAPTANAPADTKPAAAASGQPLTFFDDDSQ